MEHYFQTVPGFMWFEVAYQRLLRTLPTDRPSHWVELGSFQGQSLAWLGVEVINRQLPVTLHAVDSFVAWDCEGIPTGTDLEALFHANLAPIKQVLNGRVDVLKMQTVEAATLFEDNSVDVVWVDADHAYDACRADILAWFPKLKPGGWMGGDDFMMRPVMQAVTEQFAPDYILVHGYCTQGERKGCWPSWLVRKAA